MAAPVFADLDGVEALLRSSGARRVVLANGCFDPLHVGHVRYLAAARDHGDFLLVAINDDAGTRRLKGAGRPVMRAGDRAQLVAGLRAVNAVLIFSGDDVGAILERLRPAVHAKGTDYTPENVPEFELARRLGVRTVVAGDAKTHASRDVVSRVRGDEA